MKTTVKNLSETKVQVTISVGASELADAEKVALVKLSNTVKVPGFRKGKVPASVAAKHIDPQALQEQLMDDAISKAVAESFIAEKIQALERPTVDIKKYVPGDMLEFVAEVEVLPAVKLGDYKKLTAKAAKVAVSAKEVDEVLERMRTGLAEKKDVTRAAKNDDETLIDFVGKKDGVAFDGGTGTDYTLKLGSNQFIPGFEEAIVGHKAGEEFDIDLSFPDDYHAKDLAGEKVIFTVTLKKVTAAELPEIDDELAKKAGPFENLAELKDDIKREITAQKEKESGEKLRDDLISELIEKSTVPVPELLVQDQMRSIEQDFAQNLTYRGLDIDTYLTANGFPNEEEWREKEVKPAAERRTQASMILAELSKVEKVTATDEEIDEHVAIHRQQYEKNPETLKQFDTPEVRRDIGNHYITEKTIERLVELNGGAAATGHSH
ncbi:MAG: tig, Trigger factor [Candidatus Saccharibacteria bacterium]|nr:tig, Trigger factor [Candidatus Saccharibacteria bacterium]